MRLSHLSKLFDLLLVFILILLFIFVEEGSSYYLIWFCLIIFYYYFYNSAKKTVEVIPNIPSYIKADLLFMGFYYLIYFLPYQTSVLGMNDLTANNYLVYSYVEYSNISIVTSTIGLVAFNLGYKQQFSTLHTKNSAIKELKYYRLMPRIASLLFITVFILYVFTGAKAMFSGAYATSDVGTVTENGIFYILNHFAMLIIALVIIFYRLGSFPWVLKLSSLLVVILSLGLLIVGDRNTFFLLATVAVAGYSNYIKKVSIPKLAILIFTALFLYGVIEISRTSDERGFDAIIEAVLEGGKDEGLSESSFSITNVTSRATFAIIPEKHDYFLGKFKLIGFIGIVPFSRSLFVPPTDIYTTSSTLFKEELLGLSASWGVGTNIVSDIYMDFGVLGVILLMYSLGYFASYVKSKLVNNANSIKWGTVYIYTVALFAQLPRYSFDFPVRYIVWTLLLFYVYSFLFKKRGRKF